MLSWQARLLNGFFRFTMKRHGKKPLNLARLRAMTKNTPRRALSVPSGFKVDSVRSEEGLEFDVADVSAPRVAPASTVVLYLHGGGYLFGSPKTHRQVLIAMAKAFQAPAYGLDYRLAPEHPFPAAVEDATSAYQWLLQRHPQAQIVQLVVRDRLPHVWPVFVGILPEAREAFTTVATFAREIGARYAA